MTIKEASKLLFGFKMNSVFGEDALKASKVFLNAAKKAKTPSTKLLYESKYFTCKKISDICIQSGYDAISYKYYKEHC